MKIFATQKRNFSILMQPSKLTRDMILIDCSSKEGYVRAHIPGAIHLPVSPMRDLPPNVYTAKSFPGQFLKEQTSPTQIMSPEKFQELARSLGTK